ncbi:MAG: hypothetical protein ABL962_06800 [Fimbriimonadaceae bacterium]
MPEVPPYELKQDVESQPGGTADFIESILAKEAFDGKPVWEGRVAVFDVEGATKATRAYAWSSPVEGSILRRRLFAALRLGAIRRSQDAVRAAIVAEKRVKE